MKFHKSDTDGPTNLEMWLSENGIWQVRLDAVMFGVRVHVMKSGEYYYYTDYCCGQSPLWQQLLLHVVIAIMEKLPEDTKTIATMWPIWVKRPMVNDPVCWGKLCKLAETEPICPDTIGLDTSGYGKQDYERKLAENGITNVRYPDVWTT